jgi:gamma-glutamyltranspeptidase/glutathione hydrolase
MRSFHFPGRSPVVARKAMCATAHPLASLTAIETLKAGGNAVDAAVAACAVLCVVEPAMTGIGGDCFAMIGKGAAPPIGLNGSGRAPGAATPEWYARHKITTIEMTTPHAVLVPGSIAAWARLVAEHGKIPLDRLLTPAIELADTGYAVASRVAHDWARGQAKLERQEAARRHFLPQGRAPRTGDVMRLPALAATLRAVADFGAEGFYRGQVAADLVGELQRLGGLHTADDFASQAPSDVAPIRTRYRDVELYELPPSNQGIVALMLLKMLERLGPCEEGPGSAERHHLLVECARLAYAARDAYVADPERARVPIDHLLSDELIETLVKRVDRKRRTPDLGPIPAPRGSDTTYLTVVDEDGMAVSFINSLFADFGSGIVGPKSGVVLNNRAMGFSLDPAHPNAIGPGKRPLHTLVPAMACRDGRPWLSFGVMGGAYQPTGHVLVLTNMVDYGLDAQEALDLPRVFFEGAETVIDDSLPRTVRERLAAMGHTLRVREIPWGGGQIVEIDRKRGVLIGASDHRKDGCALGY